MLLKSLSARPYAFIDVETNGLSPTRGQIIEIGIIRVENGVVTDTYKTLVKPARPVPHMITSLTGITEEALDGAPAFEEIALRVRELLEGAIFVAHNARFDYGFIKNEFLRLDIPFSAKTLCTVKLSRSLFPKQREHNLDALISTHGLTCENRHRAYDDAYALVEFIEAIERTVGVDAVSTAIAQALGHHTLPGGLDPLNIASLPHASGVYLFYNASGDLLYIGKSVDIRSRVRSHFSGDYQSGKERALCEETRHVDHRQTTGELSALLLEAKLIKELAPIYNRKLRKRKRLATLTSTHTAAGYQSADLSYVEDIDPDTKTILGVFKTVSQGKSFLKEAAKEYRLCAKLCGIENGVGGCFGLQIGKCDGACIGKESAHTYNKRFLSALSKRQIKSWPYSGPVLIKEEPDAEEGTAYLIDRWRITKRISYTADGTHAEEPVEHTDFDYDTYKILSSFLLAQKPQQLTAVPSTHDFLYDDEPVIA